MVVTVRKVLCPEITGEPYIHLTFKGEMAHPPIVGLAIKTGAVTTLIGKVEMTPTGGWVATELEQPDLDLAIDDVKQGKRRGDILREHLAAGWRIEDRNGVV